MRWTGSKDFVTYFLDIQMGRCRFWTETNKSINNIYEGAYTLDNGTIVFGTAEKNYAWKVVDSLVIKTDVEIEEKKEKKAIYLYRIEQRDPMGHKLYERCVYSWAADNGEPGKYEVVYFDLNDPCGAVQTSYFLTDYKHGNEVVYRRNIPGNCFLPLQKGKYRYGKKHGKWYYYCSDGRVERMEKYKNGVLKKTKTRDCEI